MPGVIGARAHHAAGMLTAISVKHRIVIPRFNRFRTSTWSSLIVRRALKGRKSVAAAVVPYNAIETTKHVRMYCCCFSCKDALLTCENAIHGVPKISWMHCNF